MKKHREILLLLTVLILALPCPALTKPRAIHIEWDYPFDGNVAGYRLYLNNNNLACETQNPLASSMDCQVDLPDGETFFTLTAFFQDGSESLHSPPYSYIFSSTLKAIMTAAPIDGNTPLSVAFDGTASTGTILAYDWVFGDGGTGTGNSASNIYSTAGNYTATLKVTDNTGAVDRETVSIMAITPSAVDIPPKAVISSSLTVGDAPLDVDFDGSASYDSDGTILAYYWELGDGGIVSGKLAAHTYVAPGTFHSTLTVTDDGGLEDANSTPIIVNELSGAENIPPVAIISTSTDMGVAPLAVSFNALGSYDPDGKISGYDWSFGDGTTGSGPTVDHLFVEPGTFTVILKVTDNMGVTADGVYTITVQGYVPEQPFPVEFGTVTVSNVWTRVTTTKEFVQPVVLASPASYNDPDPAVVRIKNVDPTGFDILIQEWDYLDGIHAEETIFFLVVEQGSYTFDNGAMFEAGTFPATSRFQNQLFSTPFQVQPVVITSVMTNNEEDAVAGRIRKLTNNGFDFKLSEQESSKSGHAVETVGYLAWQTGIGSIGTLHYEVGNTENTVTNLWHQIGFETVFPEKPLFFAMIQSYNSGENSAVRYRNLTCTDVYVAIEEETSKDVEMVHINEVVGYMAFH